MSNFDWETEEEDSPSPHPRETTSIPNDRRTVILVAILIVLLISAVVVTWRLIDQAEIKEKQVEVDIISAYNIWREAVSQLDRELLSSIIVEDDPRWTATQRQLLETGLIIERQGYGFRATLPYSLPENPDYELSENWRRADLFFTQEYETEPDAEAVNLTHTVGFRREGSRWLYSHSAESFWGESLTMEFENVTATFPERDRGIASNIAGDLNQELELICWRILSSTCPEDAHIELIFDIDASILLKVSDPDLPIFKGKAYNLPTPTILGLPADDHSYQMVYEAYANPVSSAFEASLSSPLPFPDQMLQLLCYSEFGAKPRLFSYDAGNDAWSVTMPDRSFQFLSTLADDEGLLLQEYPTSTDASYLSLVSWSASDSQHLFDYGMSAIQAFPAGEYTLLNRPDILMRTISTRPENVRFNMIDGSLCDDGGCQAIELDGFPIWSPDGQHTLLWQGGTISLGDSKGKAQAVISEGFTPFWIDDHNFGLAQFTESTSGSEVVLFYGSAEEKSLIPLATSSQIAEAIGLLNSGSFFIQLAAPRPNRPNEVVLLGREYAGEDSRFFLLRAELTLDGGGFSISKVDELAVTRGTPGSYPSSLTPTGQIPFVFSSDGNHITIGRKADSDLHYWEIHVLGIDDGSQKIYKTTYPAHTFLHPYFDWSLNSQWLAIIDDGFLQLISPESNYRRLIAHDMHACSHVAWVNN